MSSQTDVRADPGSAARIVAIETIPVSIPRRPEILLRTAHGMITRSDYVLVLVRTDRDVTGLGEATVSPRWSGEDQATALRCIHTYLAPVLTSEDPMNVERLVRKMDRAIQGNVFAKAAVEMACWDIAGKLLDVPVYSLLGGQVRESVPTKFVVTATDPERAADLAQAAVQQGFQTVKVKVGIAPEEDVARVRAVRDAVGPTVRLTVDANGGWPVPVAIEVIRRLAPYDLAVVEQPVPPGNPRWLAEVRRAVPVPLMADESVFSLADAGVLAMEGAVDVLSVYPGKTGGVLRLRKIAALAEACGLACHAGSNLELGIATAALVHAAVALPSIDSERYPADIIGPRYHEHDVVVDNDFVCAGHAMAPQGSGLGVELDEGLVRACRAEVSV